MKAYTVASLADEWGCSQGVIRKAIADGRLGCFRLGTLIRIPAEEVRRFEQCQPTASNDSEAGTPSSIGTQEESGTGNGFAPPTALGLRRKQEGDGRQAIVHRGPWAGSSRHI